MPQVTQKFKNEPFDKMLRRFRNQVERAGIVKRCRELQYFEKPSALKNQKNQSLKRSCSLVRSCLNIVKCITGH